jgi:crotonobetainyl-CoA:carnitine CoA-transferase CaiB-like acyl-CoA transferase
MSAPLDGITVVSIEQAISGPLCTRHLAELGARVIKIESAGGDPRAVTMTACTACLPTSSGSTVAKSQCN